MSGAGWYQDPLCEGQLRLWTGAEWTDRVRPVSVLRAAQRPEQKDRAGVRGSWLRAIVPDSRVGIRLGVLGLLVALVGALTMPGQSSRYQVSLTESVDLSAAQNSAFVDPQPGAISAPSVPTSLVAATTSVPVVRPTVGITTTTATPTTATATTTTTTTIQSSTTVPPGAVAVKPSRSSSIAAVSPIPSSQGLPSGRATDFSLTGHRWDGCRTITISSTGPDIKAVVDELVSITHLQLQLVSGPADIEVSWGSIPIAGALGEAVYYATGASLLHVTVVLAHSSAPIFPILVRHELGHAMGLGHAQDANEVMYPYVTARSPSDYAAGDLAGLRAVGALTTGC